MVEVPQLEWRWERDIAVGPSLWLGGGWDPKVDLFECFCDSFTMFFYSRVPRKQVVCNPCACLPGCRVAVLQVLHDYCKCCRRVAAARLEQLAT